MRETPSTSLTKQEWLSSGSLASVFALRMLGLFLILPVFSVYAHKLPGGDNAFYVGLAIGIYGLTQSLFQIPFGLASDTWGRKRVIVAGLLIFAAGSFLAAGAQDIYMVMAGRALQGAGAISAAITALIADQVRETVITRAMAMVGTSIGLTFALSLVIAPILTHWWGVPGLFTMTGILAVLAISVVLWVVPKGENKHIPLPHEEHGWRDVLRDTQLLRLNAAIFALHGSQMALFVVLPPALVALGLPANEHWHLYLPAVLVGFTLMVAPIVWGEKQARVVEVLRTAAGCLAVVFALLGFFMNSSLWIVGGLMALFFTGFNVMEATLPSLISRLAPKSKKGFALGVYNTTQSIGLFVGGALGGYISEHVSSNAVFGMCAGAMVLWVVLSRGLIDPKRRRKEVPSVATSQA